MGLIRKLSIALLTLLAGVIMASGPASAQQKPNIVIIWGDDIGQSNISAYSRGVMGYKTPNIDRLANEGMMFTDYYAEQSCTAGRASFITGQSGLRTGMTKVGLPGATLGLQKEDPTIAELLKPLGYATGQFGKNHLGDRNEFLPTVHGFDEFYGNLYHLNAEEEPELPDYPKDPAFRAKYGPRGVLDCKASRHGRPDGRSAFREGGQAGVQGHRPADQGADGDDRRRHRQPGRGLHHAAEECQQAVLRLGEHRPTCISAPIPSRQSIGQSGRWQSPYHDTMIDHDKNVGTVLKALDDLGIADNTFVMYSTDNGPHMNTWPDGAMTPFRSEKNTNWEGAFRVPAMFRWPGKIKPGQVSNDIVAHYDMLPTILAVAGDPQVKDKLLNGLQNRRHDLQGPSRWRQPRALSDRAGRKEPAANRSFTSTTTNNWSRCGTTTGKSCSWSSGPREHCSSGRTRSPTCGFQRCSICGRIRTSARTSPQTPITTGSWTTPSSWCPRRIMWASSWRRSGTIRSGRRRPASTWMKSCRSLKEGCRVEVKSAISPTISGRPYPAVGRSNDGVCGFHCQLGPVRYWI